MLRVRRARSSAPTRRTRDETDLDVDAPSPSDRILALQRAIGNRAVTRLLQRDFVRDLGPTNPADWSTKRQQDVDLLALYDELAKLAKAKDELGDVKANGGKINATRRAKEGEKDVKPGLNLVGQFDDPQAGGETGFVDGDGVFRGPHLPVMLDGGLPTVAVMLGPKAFERGKDNAFAVLRHEMEHARHFEMIIDRLSEWRREAAKSGTKLNAGQSRERFTSWVRASKTMDKVQKALLLGEHAQSHANTELLAYVEGFVSVFHLGPQVPSISLMLTGDFPAAIHQLWKAGEKGQGADDAVRKLALARIRDYEAKVLTAKERAAFRDWLRFLIKLGTEKPPQGTTNEDMAAKLAHAKLKEKAVLDFLKSL